MILFYKSSQLILNLRNDLYSEDFELGIVYRLWGIFEMGLNALFFKNETTVSL